MIGELGQLQRTLPPAVMTAENGPYLVTNVTVLRTPLGEELGVPPQPTRPCSSGSAGCPR